MPNNPLAGNSLTYEQRMDAHPEWAMSEGSIFFQGHGEVQQAMYRICKRLEELEIPYAIVGGMALFEHGLRRYTEDVNLLVRADNIKEIHKHLIGRGYVLSFEKSKNLRDTVAKVKIEFLVTGQFPGDGKPKPVAFPDPVDVREIRNGRSYISLPKFIELKLASGMTNPHRGQDLVDVQRLTQQLDLPLEYREQINPYVREKYTELWKATRQTSTRYVLLRPKVASTADQSSTANETLQAMLNDGVLLDSAGGTSDDYEVLYTTNPDIARKYDMHDETEYWTDDVTEPNGADPSDADPNGRELNDADQ